MPFVSSDEKRQWQTGLWHRNKKAAFRAKARVAADESLAVQGGITPLSPEQRSWQPVPEQSRRCTKKYGRGRNH
jgi:hypothetical protein